MIAMAICMATAADASGIEAFHALDGYWRGSGLELTIDPHRAQARLDPRRPFQWEPVNIRNVEGNMVVFTIGPRLFIAYVDGDDLTLTSPGTQQPSVLRRIARVPN